MAEDGAELGSLECVRRILAARLDEPHPVGHLAVFACEQPRGSLEHGRGRVDDRDLVARSRQREALVPRSTADIDDVERRRGEVGPQVLVDHVRPDATPKRCVVVVDEALAQRVPLVLAVVGAHDRILPRGRRRSAVRSITRTRPSVGGLGRKARRGTVGPARRRWPFAVAASTQRRVLLRLSSRSARTRRLAGWSRRFRSAVRDRPRRVGDDVERAAREAEVRGIDLHHLDVRPEALTKGRGPTRVQLDRDDPRAARRAAVR